MGEQKGRVVWDLEDYLKKAELAIKDQTLWILKEEIFRTKRSPDWFWRKAKRGAGLSRAIGLDVDPEALASSYWALAKLKRDFPKEFKKIKFEPEVKKMKNKKLKMVLPAGTSIIQHLFGRMGGGAETIETTIEFHEDVLEHGNLNSFLSDLFDQLLKSNGWEHLMPKMIQILEEKELKVKICCNCKFWKTDEPRMNNIVYSLCTYYLHDLGSEGYTMPRGEDTCNNWGQQLGKKNK